MRGARSHSLSANLDGRAKIDATIAAERPPVMNDNADWRKQVFDVRVGTDEHANES
jgi:hypothetical protein